MAESFAISFASNLVSKLVENLFAPIGRQFGYVLWYKSYVRDLKNGVDKLETARVRMQHSVEEADNNGKSIEDDIKDWLESVENEANEARNLLKQSETAKDACFHGWLPNPVVRHPIGRKAKKMTQDIQGLHDKTATNNFQRVGYEDTPPGIVPTTPFPARSFNNNEDVLESRALIMEDVWKALADDKVCVIGVYGPPGVGKTKLLQDVERRVKEEKLFGVVAPVTVSHNQDLKKIQVEIACALGLKIMNEETDDGRKRRLRKKLETFSEKKILIILDDLWEKLDLSNVGIPCGDDNKVRGCKLLLASRDREILCTYMGCDPQFRLNELNHIEARKLFERTVGDKIKDAELEALIDGVVENCGGLPLLIHSMATTLKVGDAVVWRNALTDRKGAGVRSIVEQIYNGLKEERIKSLFLACALSFGTIPTTEFLIYCMGLGLYRGFNNTIAIARDKLILDLRSLKNSSLLLDGDDMKQFRMHDIFVEVAISIASTKWNALVGRKDYGFKEWSHDDLRKCTAMSFRNVGIGELPEILGCPNLKMLLLCENNPNLTIPESFFKSTKKLQVLNLAGRSFTSLPSSIEFLETLKSLCLDFCHLEDMTVLGKLKGLQFLSFVHSTITRLPQEIGGLTELRFLDLTGCTGLVVIEPGVLRNLVNLEELYMEDSFEQWEAEDETPRSNASLAELKNMKKLSTLYIAIPHSVNLSGDLPIEKLEKHKIQIGDVWDWLGEYKESKTLKLKVDPGNLLEEWVQRCLQMTQDLQLDGMRDTYDSIHDLCDKGFEKLKHLHVQNSPSFHYVVHSTGTAFTKLESLFLHNLNNLKKICPDYLASESFSKLKIVKVDNCGEIKYLFSLSMTKIFLQVEEIEINRCHLMQQIIANAEIDKDEDECPESTEIGNSQFSSYVSNLKFLKVDDCRSVLSIIPSNLLIKLQNLEAITVEKCQSIQEIFDLEGLITNGDVKILLRLTKLTLRYLPRLGRICNKNPRKALCFGNLRALKVQHCESLRFLFSSYMAKALGQIEEIEIASCKLMKEFMDVQEDESEEAATTSTLEFPRLASLSLEELPNLKTFSSGTYCINCPSLRRLRISKCPIMITFSSFEGKQQPMIANTGSQQVLGRNNSSLSLPVFFNQNVIFPSLEELKLFSCGLRRIWPNELPEKSFHKLASIMVEDCENLSHIFPSSLIERFQSLKMIEVVNCTSLEALTEHVMTSSTKATLGLPSLTNVRLCRCRSLKYLFTYDTARTLDRLEMLDVSDCDNMQEVVSVEEGEERKLKAMKFSHLCTLKLCFLKSLVSFSSGSCAYEFPSLKEFIVQDCKAVELIVGDASCKKLEGSIPMQQPLLLVKKVMFPSMESMKISHMNNIVKIWLDDLAPNAFSELKTLIVEDCEKLSFIFSSDTVLAKFGNLEKLIVTNCSSLEAVFHFQEFNFSEVHSMGTFRLRELVLVRLPNMKHVWSGLPQGALTFGRLQCIEVVECKSLKSLFPGWVAQRMTQLKELKVWDCGVEEIIAEVDGGVGMSACDLFFPRLTTLTLLHLPQLRSFYMNCHTSTWPHLKKTWPHLKNWRVKHCGKMRSFSFACETPNWQGITTNDNQHAHFSNRTA